MALELVDLLERMEPRVGTDPDADRTRRERDQPDPVALAEQVVGAAAGGDRALASRAIQSTCRGPKSSMSSPPASRNQAELIVCPTSLARPSLRFSRLARPAASTTQRAVVDAVFVHLA